MNNLKISEENWSRLVNAFPQIAVLIGAADGNMDDEEKAWSNKVAHIRTFSGRKELFSLYEEVEAKMNDKIAELLKGYDTNAEAAEQAIISDLETVNDILHGMDTEMGARLYKDYKSFAKHVGKASGGFLRFFSVSKEERDLAALPMLEEVIHEED